MKDNVRRSAVSRQSVSRGRASVQPRDRREVARRAIKRLFEQFDAMLRRAGYIAIGSDHRCQPGCGAAAAQYGRREEGDQGGPCTGELEGQASQAAAQGSRRALAGQIHQGQTARGWLNAASRSGHPAIWLSEPCLDRSPFRLHPPMDNHRCGCL
jgi:hypothetical protein